MTSGTRGGLVAAALAVTVGIAGVALIVLPQRNEANALDRRIAAARIQVDQADAFAKAYHPEALDSADLFRLSKSMPADTGMPDLLLQLDRIASSAGVTIDSLVPRTAVKHGGYHSIPLDLVAKGSFYAVSDFLLRLRSSVRVRGANLDVTGRLYAIDGLSLSRPSRSGDITANVAVSAFAFDGGAALPSAAGTAPSAAAATRTVTR
jgi:hypothetical protein